jgi:hypothetical protein
MKKFTVVLDSGDRVVELSAREVVNFFGEYCRETINILDDTAAKYILVQGKNNKIILRKI